MPRHSMPGCGRPAPLGTRFDQFHYGLIMTSCRVDLGLLGGVNQILDGTSSRERHPQVHLLTHPRHPACRYASFLSRPPWLGRLHERALC
jgi:hypothetical protein